MRTMLFQSTLACLFGLFCLNISAQLARAETQEVVDYRLTQWKKKHFHDSQKANLHLTTLKKLGCEVQQDEHDGHIDLSYRCPKWRRMSLQTHSAAHRWENWLKSAGFETHHEH